MTDHELAKKLFDTLIAVQRSVCVALCHEAEHCKLCETINDMLLGAEAELARMEEIVDG